MDNGSPVLFWLRDWSAWIIAGISTAISAATVVWRHSLKKVIEAMQRENKSALADLSERTKAIESRDREFTIQLTKLSTLSEAIIRIEATVIRLEERLNQVPPRWWR